jgi:small-conductance mechanosensitive channel
MPDLNEPTPSTDEIEQITSLLSGEEPEKAPEAAEPEKEEEAATEEAAEESALDYGMEVPMTNGEKVTLGKLKDAWQARDTAMLEMTERENSVLRETEKAVQLLQYVEQLPPELRAQAAKQADLDYQREMKTLATILPEATKPEGAAEIREGLYALADEYGLPRGSVDQIKSAVTIKMMWDFARLKASIKAAKANVKPLRADSPKAVAGVPASKSDLQAAIDKAKHSRNTQDEAKAIDALLRSA